MESESEYFDFECVFEGKAEDLKKILQDKSFDSLIIKNVKISDNKLETLDKSIFGAKYKVEVCEKFQSLLWSFSNSPCEFTTYFCPFPIPSPIP